MTTSVASSTATTAARKEAIHVDDLPHALAVIDCEKRRGVSRYYAYVIEVTRRNGEKYHIYRRYRQFHKMIQRLEERFPIEAGSIRASDRVLPQLPGKKYVGRSAVRDVAEIRLPYLDDFLKRMCVMSDKIKYDSILLAFLKPNHEDINRPYRQSVTYPVGRTNGSREGSTSPPERPKPPRLLRQTRSNPPNLSLPVPTIQVTSSSPTSKVPPPRPNPPKLNSPRPTPPKLNSPNLLPKPRPNAIVKGPRAKVLYNYTSQYDDEISLKAGSIVSLLRKLEGSWYEGKVNSDVGLVPGNYLSIIEPLPDEESSEETDEWDDDSCRGQIVCFYKSKQMKIDVDMELIKRPTFNKLMFAIRGQLKDSRITINYKDSSGDLVQIVDDDDLQIMKEQSGKFNSQTDIAPWKLYITKSGDITVYNTHPY